VYNIDDVCIVIEKRGSYTALHEYNFYTANNNNLFDIGSKTLTRVHLTMIQKRKYTIIHVLSEHILTFIII